MNFQISIYLPADIDPISQLTLPDKEHPHYMNNLKFECTTDKRFNKVRILFSRGRGGWQHDI